MRRGVVLFLVLLLGGCQVGYYSHLFAGHARLMRDREPVEHVLAEQQASPDVLHKLRLSRALRLYAEENLQLPVGDAYDDYAELDRDWATWNLLAAPRFSLEPYTWCYPVVGCASYRGYFDRERATRERQRLERAGLDVHEAGSSAYSTLGWFDDPLLSTMMAGDDWQFAELLFHELTHRRLYVRDDTRFNESLATAVGRDGVRRWVAATAPEQADDVARLLEGRARARATVTGLVDDTRQRLQQVYDAPLSEVEKTALSRALRWQLRARFRAALREYPLLAGYEGWFAGSLNNAQLNTMNDYEGWVPAFDQVMRECDGRLECFWRRVDTLAQLPGEQRHERMQELMERADGTS